LDSVSEIEYEKHVNLTISACFPKCINSFYSANLESDGDANILSYTYVATYKELLSN